MVRAGAGSCRRTWQGRWPVRLIVVGSGIVGASCAYTASSLGAEVVLVDAGMPGRATAAGAGIICPWSSAVEDPAWCSLAYPAAREYPALIGRLADLGEADVGYRRGGALGPAGGQGPGAGRAPVGESRRT